MTERAIHLESRGALAQLVLDRPNKRNALSADMWRAITELVGAAGADPAVKVLILRGVSAEAFSAGADIAEFDRVHATAASAREYHAVVAAAYEALAGLAKPTIALVRAPASAAAARSRCAATCATPTRPRASASRPRGSGSPTRSARPSGWSTWSGRPGPRRC